MPKATVVFNAEGAQPPLGNIRQRPLVAQMTVVALYKNEFIEPITVEWYGKGQTVKAVLFIRDRKRGFYRRGLGSTTGSGYHRESAALESALVSAGIELPFRVDSRGETACIQALKAISRKLGYRKTHIVKF